MVKTPFSENLMIIFVYSHMGENKFVDGNFDLQVNIVNIFFRGRCVLCYVSDCHQEQVTNRQLDIHDMVDLQIANKSYFWYDQHCSEIPYHAYRQRWAFL